MTRDQIIEAMEFARARYIMGCMGGDRGTDKKEMSAILDSLEAAIPGLADVISGTHVIVPVEPTEGMLTAGFFASDSVQMMYAAMLAARGSEMAGSLAHIVNEDGTFTMDLIENMGDAHEALEECHQIIADLSSRWGGTSVLMHSMDRLGFPKPKTAPVLQAELLGVNSPVRKALMAKGG